ncbi:hypothetical protein KKG41_04385 [Patescibacteria group bacterium]|nr:hypothetical protein [Patescibacteria group bacterium]MBU1890791.1 hypothetical protein [Patescibacteria group bacterium]
MNRPIATLIIVLVVVVVGVSIYNIVNEKTTEDTNSNVVSDTGVENMSKAKISEVNYETISFRDQDHSIYLDVPKDWKTSNTDYEIDERVPMIRFELDVFDEYGSPIGDAMIAYYNAGGSTLEEWAQLHFVNDIKREFGEDFIMTSFNGELEKGVEIIGTNKLHPLWPPNFNNIYFYTYYYYLHDDKVYEFELLFPEKYLSNYQDELSTLRDSVHFGEPYHFDEWNTYTNEEKGFSVKYPTIWKTSEYWEQIGGFVGFDEIEDLFEGHKVVIVTPTEEGYTSSLAGQTRLENVQLSYPRMGDVPAVRISGDVPEPTYGFSDYSDSVFVMVDGAKIKMTYQEIGFDLESREYFDQMVKTFEFLE